MTKIGTTFTKSGKKAVLCGSGELGKEVALELQRYGVEVVALDKYENAPAMHVAHRSHVLSMLDGDALEAVIREEKPDYIIPEIEAIATDRLVKLEEEGFNVIPTAMATRLTMNREGSPAYALKSTAVRRVDSLERMVLPLEDMANFLVIFASTCRIRSSVTFNLIAVSRIDSPSARPCKTAFFISTE